MSNIQEKSFFEKMKKDPMPAIGMVGFLGVVGYSLWNYRNKDAATKTSVYMIHTRVAAQGLVIGVLTLTVGYHMLQKLIFPEQNSKHEQHHYVHKQLEQK